MSQRRRTSVIALAALCVGVVLSTTLAACGDDSDGTTETATSTSPSASPSPSTSASESETAAASGELPTVKGGFGETPTITVPDADPPSDLVVKTLSEGDGPAVRVGRDHRRRLRRSAVGGRRAVFDSSFDRGSPAGFGIGIGAVIPGWDSGLVGVKAGTRVLMVLPPDEAYGDIASR